MALDDHLSCLEGMTAALRAQGLDPGSINHALEQMHAKFSDEAQGLQATLEVAVRDAEGKLIRSIDVVTTGVLDGFRTRIHTEIKTGTEDFASALNLRQLRVDALEAIRAATDTGIDEFQNEWRHTNITFNEQTVATLQTRMEQLVSRLVAEGFSPEQIRTALASFNFVDKAGQAMTVELESQTDMFGKAMEVVSVKLSQAAEEEMGGSPDFGPAMEIAFGAGGKLSDAATAAAQGANLEPALENFETKIEEGVSEALDEAGQAAADKAGESLGASIAGGATALGNIFTSIPQMHQQITALGEAWDQPLDSTEAYMNLFSAVGGTITQGVQTFEALAGITKVASAAQAIFNAVMAMNPIVLIVMAVIVLIGLIVLLIVYWDEVCAAVRDNPWIAAIGLIFGPIGILIALIVLIAAHWEEVKLAVLQAANFISIQAQRIAAFFVGIYTVAGQVWDIIVATAINAGIGIANAFISVGTEIQNFFIGVINGILEMYNAVAESAIGEFVGLEPAELIPEVDVETRLIPPREVPELDVDAAFNTGSITGGLEDMIAEQEAAVAEARAADESRRAADAAAEAAPPAAAPGAPAGAPALPGLPGGAPAALPAGLPAAPPGLPRPALPEGAAAAAAAPGPVDASVTVNGGITVNISAERLEADAAELLSDDIIAQLQARLGSLRSEQDFRTGVR